VIDADCGPVIFHRRTVPTTGLPSYARAHLRSSIAINPRLFAEGADPPARLTVTADGLRVPVDPQDPGILAAHAYAAQQRAETARQRARDLTGIADRHAARLNRL
jgi:hypothetical protein